MDLKLQVRKYITAQRMIGRGDHVIIGLSGGADSVCLLCILAGLRGEMNLTLTAMHVNHGIRGEEADADAAFAENLCRSLEITFRLCHTDIPELAERTGMSLEEAGRQERYRFFREEAERQRQQICSRETAGSHVLIATAHHMDDQAETVLMNLCRGSGIRGIGGIAPVSGDIIRPLLCVRKSEITEWLLGQGQTWREDHTNRDREYTRNRIRLEILPEMTEYVNTRTVEHLSSIAEQARELNEWLESEADQWISGNTETSAAGCTFRCNELKPFPKALRTRILHRILAGEAGRAKDLTARHLAALDQLLEGDKGGSLDLPYGLRAVRTGGEMRIGKAECASDTEIFLLPDIETELSVFYYSEKNFMEKRYTKWFDYDKIKGTVLIRTRESEDYLSLEGGRHKPLRRYMIDAHIPAEVRERIPVLACGHRILWVIGYRSDPEYCVTEDTRRVLAVTVRRK